MMRISTTRTIDLVATALLAAGCTDTGPEPTPVTTHPRPFLTSADVPRLRGWAVASNPIWANGLLPIATQARVPAACS